MSRTVVQIPADYVSVPFEHATSVGTIVRRVLRRVDQGPPVILIHEVPGLSERTFAIAASLERLHFTVVLPELLDAPIGPGMSMVRLCIAREMGALSHRKPGAVVEWLRALAVRESNKSEGRSVGVVGMCFSGGFALGAVLEPKVRAAVVSQPALPFLTSSLGLSKGQLDDVRECVANGARIRGLRYRLDIKSPRGKLKRLKSELPSADIDIIPTWNPMRHSVLGDGVEAQSETRLGKSYAKTLTFLKDALDWEPPADL